MEKNNYKLIKWKILGVNTKTLIITFLSFCFCVQLSFSTDILVWPKEIKFDYDNTGYSNDAVTIKMDKDNYVPVPEWIKDGINEKCAYIKGQSNRKIKIKFDSNSDNMNFLIKTTVITGEGIGVVCEAFVAECDLNNEFITLNLTGSIPASVGKRTFEWKWEATALPVNSPYCPIVCEPCTTTHTYYTLLAAPQAPMTEPWTSVLDLACIWASNKTSEAQAVADITINAYNYFGQSKIYYGGDTHAPGKTFHLTNFFNDDWGDCRDMSAVVHVFTRAIGGDLTQVKIISGWFYYKPIRPVGWTHWTDEDELEDKWNFHQVGWKSNVYDACLKLVKSSPRIPINEDINGLYKNDLFDWGYWNPQNPFNYISVD